MQEQLGHTSIVLTDTYTSVLVQRHLKIAEATARLVLAAAARSHAVNAAVGIGCARRPTIMRPQRLPRRADRNRRGPTENVTDTHGRSSAHG